MDKNKLLMFWKEFFWQIIFTIFILGSVAAFWQVGIPGFLGEKISFEVEHRHCPAGEERCNKISTSKDIPVTFYQGDI